MTLKPVKTVMVIALRGGLKTSWEVTVPIPSRGDNESNILFGNAGQDTLEGRGGNDTLIGGDGADTLRGGSGNDRISAGDGVDVIDGGEGADILDYSLNGQDSKRLCMSILQKGSLTPLKMDRKPR